MFTIVKVIKQYQGDFCTVTIYDHPNAIGGAIVEIQHGDHIVTEEFKGIKGLEDALALTEQAALLARCLLTLRPSWGAVESGTNRSA